MRTYIWTWPTRLFHWLLAGAFTAAYLLGEEEHFFEWHAAAGTFIGCLALFRILQGFTGPKYARFSDFPVSPASLFAFLKNMKQSKTQHAGHNPAAAIVMLGILVAAILSAFSGVMILAGGEEGFLGIKIALGADPEMFEDFHEVVVNVFLVLVIIHLTGILADTLFHPGNGTLLSMITGYKRLNAEPARLTLFGKLFSVLWFCLPFLLFIYVLTNQSTRAGEDRKTELGVPHEEKDEEEED